MCIRDSCRRALWGNTGLFLVFFLAFVIRTLLAEGYAVNPETGEVFMEPYSGGEGDSSILFSFGLFLKVTEGSF